MLSPNVTRWLGVGLLAGAAVLLFRAPAYAQSAEPVVATVTAAVAEPGVLIVAVEPDSPAYEAGIRRGDIVLAAGDVQVDDAQALAATVAGLSPGDRLVLTVQHGDEERTVEVTLAERNGAPFLGVRPYWSPVQGQVAVRSLRTLPAPGMRFRPGAGAAPWSADPIHITSTVGIHVSAVMPDGPAARAGLETGDLITAIDGTAVTPATDLAALVAEHQPGDELTLTVQRPTGAGGKQTVTVTLGAKPDDPEAAYLGVQVVPMFRIWTEQVPMSRMGARGGMWQFHRRAPGDRLDFFRAAPVPPMPAMPPLWMMPYGYWYGAPGFGVPYMAPPTDFIYLHPMPNILPNAGVRFFVQPLPGAETESFRWEEAPPDLMVPAQPAQPVQVEVETEVTI